MSKDSQCFAILQYMKEVGPITAKIARDICGCERLAARIHVLRGKGYDIKTTERMYINKAGNVVRYAVYSLEGTNA
jgi:hypothetical protein